MLTKVKKTTTMNIPERKHLCADGKGNHIFYMHLSGKGNLTLTRGMLVFYDISKGAMYAQWVHGSFSCAQLILPDVAGCFSQAANAAFIVDMRTEDEV